MKKMARFICVILTVLLALNTAPVAAPAYAAGAVSVEYAIADLYTLFGLSVPSGHAVTAVTDSSGGMPDASYAASVSYAKSQGWLPAVIPPFKSAATAEFVLKVSMAMGGYKNIYPAQKTVLEVSNMVFELIKKNGMENGGIASFSQALDVNTYDHIKNAHRRQTVPIAVNTVGYDLYGKGEREKALYAFEMLTGVLETGDANKLYKANAYYGLGSVYASQDFMMYEKAKECFEKCIALDTKGEAGDFGGKARKMLDGLPNLIFSRTYNSNENVTYQDFVAMMNFYMFRSATAGEKLSNDTADMKGAQPSDYALAAVRLSGPGAREYYEEKPSSWTDPVARWWAAEYVCRMRGSYNYSVANINPFEDMFGMTAEQKMYMSKAVETGLLFPLSATSANPGGTIKRGEVYEIAGRMKNVVEPQPEAHPSGAEPKVHAYYTALLGNDGDLEIFDRYKGKVDMVTFLTTFLKIPEKRFLEADGTKYIATYYGNDLDHTGYTQFRLDALKKAKEAGCEIYFGFSIDYGDTETVTEVTQYLVSLINDGKKLSDLCADVVKLCKKYGYDGVNMSIELVDITMEQHTKLAKAMSEALRKEKLKLMISVGAFSRDVAMNSSFYDYPVLSNLADYIHMLTYDYTSVSNYAQFGQPGFVSSYESIVRSVKYALYSMPPEKIIMGFGTYGIDYTLGTKEAQNITHEEIAERIKSSKTTPVYAVDDEKNDNGPYVEYTDSSGVKHRIAYDTKESFEKRMQFAYDYGLGGVSYYWLGSESDGFYEALDAVYGRSYAQPVTEASSWAHGELSSAVSAGLLPEYLQNNYKQYITRNEFFGIIRLVIEKLGKDASYPEDQAFPDSASEAALWAMKTGVTSVSIDKPFSPYRTISRQEAAMVMSNAASKIMGQNTSSSPQTSYADQTKIAAWAAGAVNYVSDIDVMKGVGTAGFSPAGNLSREQAYLIAYRFYEAMKGK